MATGFRRSDGVDLDSVFAPRGTLTAIANTQFRDVNGTDFAQLFAPVTSGTASVTDTGFRDVNGVDLRQIFAAAGTVNSGGGGGGGGGDDGCFVRCTPIKMANGAIKTIGEVVVGDALLGYTAPGLPDDVSWTISNWSLDNPDVGQLVPVRVVNVRHRSYREHFLINHDLRVTYEHGLFCCSDARWRFVEARTLPRGGALLTDQLLPLFIESIELIREPMNVVSLDVEDADTYFVGCNQHFVLAHNAVPIKP